MIRFVNPLAACVKRVLSINHKTRPGSRCNMSKDCSIVWLDLEMTGLEQQRDKILEVACIITDKALNIIAEGPNVAIYQPEEVLANMSEWCIHQHNETKLIERCRASKLTTSQVESMLLEFLQKHVPRGKCPLAGNSIYVDRAFLRKEMPSVDDYLHYRIIDVSTVKELCRRWNPNVAAGAPKKKLTHRSMDDIKESIEEMRYYKSTFFQVNKRDRLK